MEASLTHEAFSEHANTNFQVLVDENTALVELGPHRAVAKEDALGKKVKNMRHDQTAWQATAAVAARTPIM